MAGNTERGAGMTDRTEALAEQTRLLIAVRDRRDREAFAALFAHYAPRLKAMLRRGAMRDSEAEEVVQEAMLAVWHKAAQFDPGRASASAWIYRIARNRQIDIFRREGRPVPDELTQAPPPEPDASDALAFDQEARRLRAALDALPPEQRDMVERAYLGELSHSEIACDTGLPLGTIKSRIRLALERLRHELKDLRQT
ncbi:MAG: sigma-70 family RNA polymerase sigma factor [Albidovulum sp.]